MSSSYPETMRPVLTCEHAGNMLPPDYLPLFEGAQDIFETHMAYDIGVMELAEGLGRELGIHVFSSPVSRLLVDLNRNPSSRTLFSPFTRVLPKDMREKILCDYYAPYRSRVEEHIDSILADGRPVLHISQHTFTPVLEGFERKTDIGLLYDPKRPRERSLCRLMASRLGAVAGDFVVRMNYPYTGVSDSFTTYLRKKHPPESYFGIEIEVNQKHYLSGKDRWPRIMKALAQSIATAAAQAHT